MPQPPERYSRAPLPPYRYVPGQTPHPLRDPRGYGYGSELDEEAEAVEIDSERWAECESYLSAIDLFNLGYYWQAHECLEALWRGAGPASELGVLLQGVIQLAAALLKREMGEGEGAKRLAAKGCAKLRRVPGECLGIDRALLADAVEGYVLGHRGDAPVIRLIGWPAEGASSEPGE